MTNEQILAQLKELMPQHNNEVDGVDAKKRNLAIALFVGPKTPDNTQTDRFCNLAIAFAEARR